MPGGARSQAYLKSDPAIFVRGRGFCAFDAQRKPAMNAGRALVTLHVIFMLSFVIKDQLPPLFHLAPIPRELAELAADAFRLDHVREIRVHLKLQTKDGRLPGEVRKVDIFVYALSDIARQAQLICPLPWSGS